MSMETFTTSDGVRIACHVDDFTDPSMEILKEFS